MQPQIEDGISPAELPKSPEQETAARSEQLLRLDALAGRLSREAISRVGMRQTIEERWLQDLRQFNGVYEADVLQTIKSNDGSQVYVNITRPRTKVAEARLGDMLFPTDDKNWAIKPTPVPELAAQLGDKRIAVDAKTGATMRDDVGNPKTVSDMAAQVMEEAKKRAEAMSAEIDDQLTESKYNSECRLVIHDSCLLGSGVLKGPIVVGRTRRKWTTVRKGSTSVQVITRVTDPRPAVKRVFPWNFFPETAAAMIEQSASNYERDYLTARQMRKLKEDPYYIKENVTRALTAGAKASQMTRNPTNDMRAAGYNINGDTLPQTESDLYEVWEYHGAITAGDLRACGCEVDEAEDDNNEQEGCVVFCGSVVIKAYINPMETGEGIYSIFNYEKDEASIFGYGVPFRMRNAQRVLNAAWRALMDNTALSVGPQIIINKGLVEPQDGLYTLKARKVWTLTDRTRDVREAFGTFDIPNHQNELQAIIDLALRFADEETNLPIIKQSDEAPQVQQTATGMSMVLNAQNVVTRATVKNFDDGITTPQITRFYDYNMQNSPREDIKGDFEIDARGSSALLAKEIQAQNLMMLATNFSAHPVFGPMTKAVQLYRKVVQSMHVSDEDVVKSDDELTKDAEQAGQQPQDPAIQVEQMRQEFETKMLDSKMQQEERLEELRHQSRMQEAEMEQQNLLIRVASEEKTTVADLQARLQLNRENIQGKRQLMADETRVKMALGSGV